MAYSKVEAAALDLARPAAQAMGYQVYDVEYCKEGPHWFLRVFINREQGVSLDDCEAISRELSKGLDQQDFIPGNYFLEVSSPGLERVLRQEEHFRGAVGETVRLKLFAPVAGMREIEGVLSQAEPERMILQTEGNVYSVAVKNIAKASVVFDFSQI